MKKRVPVLWALLLVLVRALSACTDKPEQESQTGNTLPGVADSQQPGGTESGTPIDPTQTDAVLTSTEEEETVTDEFVVEIGTDEEVIGG